MTHFLASPLSTWLFHWGASFLIWGALFVLVGILVGWFSWRHCRAEAERIEASNNRLKSEHERVKKEIDDLDSQISDLEHAYS